MAAKKKLPFPQLIRAFWGPYLRLAQYLHPYRKRFVMGLVFGVLAGMVNGGIPAVLYVVGASTIPRATLSSTPAVTPANSAAPAATAAAPSPSPTPQQAPKKGSLMKRLVSYLPSAENMSMQAKFAILMIIPLVIFARGISDT